MNALCWLTGVALVIWAFDLSTWQAVAVVVLTFALLPSAPWRPPPRPPTLRDTGPCTPPPPPVDPYH